MPAMPATRLLSSSALVLSLAATLIAQTPPAADQAQRVERRNAKRGKPVFGRLGFVFDYDSARQQAKQQERAVLAYFTVSAAPNPDCDAAEAGLLATPEFAAIARDFVPFAHITSGVDGEPYPNLMHRLVGPIAPSLAFVDAEGQVLAIVRPLDQATLADKAEKVQALLAARRTPTTAADPQARQRAVFLAELDLGLIPAAQVAARADSAGLSTEQRRELDPRLLDAELSLIVAGTTTANRNAQAAAVAALHAAGRRPTEAMAFQFWGYLLLHAAAVKDGKLADDAFAELVRRESKTKDMLRVLAAREEWQKLVDAAKQQ